jgi:hypothetical protein
MTEPTTELDPQKVRIGLIIIAAVFVVSVLGVVIVDDPAGKVIFATAAVLTLLRGGLVLLRLRRGPRVDG